MRSVSLVALTLLLLLACCESDSVIRTRQTLEGTWDLVGYTDHGVSAATTGTAAFQDDGTFLVLGTVTFPGEPTDSLDASGTYQVVGATVKLTTPDDSGTWSLLFAADYAVLGLLGSDPPTKMTLKRRW